MNDELEFHFGGRKFYPVSVKFFNTYAKNLSRLTGDGLQRSRETLAQIYGYRNVFELQKALEEEYIPGPFEDEINYENADVEAIQDALNTRNALALHIILERGQAFYANGAPAPNLFQVSVLELFSSPKSHLQAFRSLQIPKTTSKERMQERRKYLPCIDADEPMQAKVPVGKVTDSIMEVEESVHFSQPPLKKEPPAVVVTHKRRKQILKPSE
ncbi:hypothetical protein [Noviherbaspirillum sp. Root189]|uniref:hypothetical protein n=1 Tax=Noviherbaspirillum sp. Root189 TaxID=1736487 RepID=UPI00070E133B|nr:hypothetical protein [Noviherbaspirillum sp. Root189]KRB79046.1 hypothetical protein ASE07_04985 [Noviherbaspirillum sp. Root189]